MVCEAPVLNAGGLSLREHKQCNLPEENEDCEYPAQKPHKRERGKPSSVAHVLMIQMDTRQYRNWSCNNTENNRYEKLGEWHLPQLDICTCPDNLGEYLPPMRDQSSNH